MPLQSRRGWRPERERAAGRAPRGSPVTNRLCLGVSAFGDALDLRVELDLRAAHLTAQTEPGKSEAQDHQAPSGGLGCGSSAGVDSDAGCQQAEGQCGGGLLTISLEHIECVRARA